MSDNWFFLLLAVAMLGVGIFVELGDRKADHCAGLYSLALTNADSLAIARDGCAAYLGRKEGTE